jgi:polyphosphate glucokinase
MQILGVDIGGTGIKGAPVNTKTGKLLAERFRIETPSPATPEAVADTVAQIVDQFKWKGSLGVTVPAVVKEGKLMTAANIDDSWLGINAHTLFRKRLKLKTMVLNDADAAGIAEMRFGAGKGHEGLVLMVTLGTGIGTALFYRGLLIPNSELGHLELHGRDAEKRASNRVREKKDLSWEKWGEHVDEYLEALEKLLWPDLFIIGGGVSKKASAFFPFIARRAKVVPAKLANEAGIVGAALASARHFHNL